MTQLQKLVKYAATALAVILIINIFFGIFAAFTALGFIFENFGDKSDSEYNPTVTDKKFFTADTLKIDLGASKLIIKDGEELFASLASSDDSIEIKESGGTLSIIEKHKTLRHNNHPAEITLCVPSEIVFESVDIKSGAGRIDIDSLSAGKIRFEIGAGLSVINRLSVTDSAEISVGAGKLDIKDGTLCNLILNIGVGSAELKSKLVGRSRLNYGIGSAKIILNGTDDDYRIDFEKGISTARISGKTANSETVYGDGDSRISIEGGIGSVSVDFSDQTE